MPRSGTGVSVTGQDLRKLATVARLAVESSADRQLAKADLADSFVICAAYLWDRGDTDLAIGLLRRAGEVCQGYDQIHAGIGGAL
jgi:hypothetical protein